MKTTPDMHKLFFSLQIILAVWISNHHSYAQTTVTFRITNLPEDQGKNVGIRGNTYPLDWGKSILTGGNDSVREVTLTFPQNTGKIEFKFVTFDKDQNPTWENISNRELLPGEEGTLISQNIWNQEPVIDIQSLDKIQPEELLKDFERNPLLFKGKVYLLTSPANTSLAFYTAYQFQKQSIGIIIGEETGGNLNDINGGQILFLRLPNSKIEIDFPVMGAFALGDQPNSGVIPDVVVRTTYEDIIQNRDPQLAAVLRMIAKD